MGKKHSGFSVGRGGGKYPGSGWSRPGGGSVPRGGWQPVPKEGYCLVLAVLILASTFAMVGALGAGTVALARWIA